MRTINDYLASFNENVNKRYKKQFTVDTLMNDVSKRRIILKDGNVFNSEPLKFDYLDELSTTIDSIISIAASPKFELKEIYDVRNREQVSKIDSHSIIDTTKENSFWSEETVTGAPTPTRMVTKISEIYYGTYENRFVKKLIDDLVRFVTRQCNLIMAQIDYLGKGFMNNEVFYSDATEVDKLNRFKTFKYTRKSNSTRRPLLIKGESEYQEPLTRLLKIRSSLYNMMNSKFYKDVDACPDFTDAVVKKTNVFAGEKNYRRCYTFYNSTLRKINRKIQSYTVVNKLQYRDYVVVSLIRSLKKLNFKFDKTKLHLSRKHFVLKGLKCVNKDGVICYIRTSSIDVQLEFEVKYLHGKFHKTLGLNERRFNKVSLLLNPSPVGNLSKDEFVEFIKDSVDARIQKGFDNAFFVTPDSSILRDDLIFCSPSGDKADNSFANAISSCLIFIEANKDIYSRICPVCGSRINVAEEQGNCHCSVCESTFAFLVSGDQKKYKTTVWIKRIKRVE